MRVPFRRPLTAAALLLAAAALPATQTRFVPSASQDLTAGWPQGVRVLPEGVLVPGPTFAKGADLPGTALCALRRGEDLFVGTGSTGDLLRVSGGAVAVVHHFAEPLLTALAAGPSGIVYVGTSGPARVYAVDPKSGAVSAVADLPGQYCWALLPRGDDLLAATGVPGGLYRVRAGKPPVSLADPNAQHVRALLDDGTRVWFGTATPAALFALEGDRVRRVASFEGEELSALVSSGGALFAALNEKGSTPAPEPPKEGGAPPPPPVTGPGQVFEVPSGGAPRRAAAFPSAVLCLAVSGTEVLAGTRDGGLYALAAGGASLLARWEDAPVSALLYDGPRGCAVTAAPGALWLSGPSQASRFDSPVLDAGSPARVSALEGFGEGTFALSVRGGTGSSPDAFWSGWLPAARAAELAPARFLQWRAELAGPGAVVRGVRFAYRPQNRPPLLDAVKVAPPGEVQVKSSSQLGEQLVQEVHSKDRPFPSLAESKPAPGGTQTYYLQGFRMVTFTASDPDGDDVRVDVALQPEGGGGWVTLAEQVADPFFVFESRALPDGRYLLKVVARDDAGNPEGEALSTEKVLPVFEVDNTPPRLEEAGRGAGLLKVDLADSDAVRAARFCLDGAPWVPLAAQGGAFGRRSVTVEVPLPKTGRHWLAVEAVDAQGNRAVRGWIVP